MVDAARRRTIKWDAEPRCAGCGVELVDGDTGAHRYIAGCSTCADRRSKHRRRDASTSAASAG
jgi:hypothetical protein